MRAFLCALMMAGCKGQNATAADSGPPPEPSAFRLSTATNLMPTTPSLPVPLDWPPEVPIYAGAHISKVGARAIPGDGGVVHELEFQTIAGIDRIIEFYRGAFPHAKKVIEFNLPMTYGLRFEWAEEAIDVAVVSAMGVTQVKLTVSPP